MRAFVAVVDEGGFSAGARRLHLSQPAVSQTVHGLERELGVELVVRSASGVRVTDAGAELLSRARALLAAHDATVVAVSIHGADRSGVLRLGVPLELPSGLLAGALARLGADFPDAKVQVGHLSTSAQLAALRAGELDVGLVRERPVGPELDTIPVLRERLGVLLSTPLAETLSRDGAVALEALAGLTWIAFNRDGSPAWFDEVSAVLRSHGLEAGPPPGDRILIPEVKLAAVQGGQAFTLAPPDWSQTIPPGVTWCALTGDPLVRRTWAAWPAVSRRRDLGALVAALEAGAAPDGPARP